MVGVASVGGKGRKRKVMGGLKRSTEIWNLGSHGNQLLRGPGQLHTWDLKLFDIFNRWWQNQQYYGERCVISIQTNVSSLFVTEFKMNIQLKTYNYTPWFESEASQVGWLGHVISVAMKLLSTKKVFWLWKDEPEGVTTDSPPRPDLNYNYTQQVFAHLGLNFCVCEDPHWHYTLGKWPIRQSCFYLWLCCHQESHNVLLCRTGTSPTVCEPSLWLLPVMLLVTIVCVSGSEASSSHLLLTLLFLVLTLLPIITCTCSCSPASNCAHTDTLRCAHTHPRLTDSDSSSSSVVFSSAPESLSFHTVWCQTEKCGATVTQWRVVTFRG